MITRLTSSNNWKCWLQHCGKASIGKLSNFHSTLYTLLTSYVYHLKFRGFLILIYVTIRISILFHVVCRLMQFSATEGILSYGGRFSATLTNQLHKVVEFPPL